MEFDEWVKVGRLAKELSDISTKVAVSTSNKFGKTSKIARRAEKAMKSMTDVKDNLEEVFCKEYPNRFDTHVFYGPYKYNLEGRYIDGELEDFIINDEKLQL